MKGHRVFCVFILGLIVPYLDQTLESAPQEKRRFLAPQHCDSPWFELGNSSCPSAIPNCSCHHTVEEWNWFEACYEKTTGYLRRVKALWRLGMKSVRQLGRVWQKLSEVILSCLVHCFDFYCVSCAVLGNSQILRPSGAGNDNSHHIIFRRNQAPVQGSDTDRRNQNTGPFVCPRNDSHQDPWRQQWLLPLSDLVWTSGALSDKESPFTITDSGKLMLFSECLSYCIQNGSFLEKTTLFRFGSELQRKWSRYWQNYNQTKVLQKDVSS